MFHSALLHQLPARSSFFHALPQLNSPRSQSIPLQRRCEWRGTKGREVCCCAGVALGQDSLLTPVPRHLHLNDNVLMTEF